MTHGFPMLAFGKLSLAGSLFLAIALLGCGKKQAPVPPRPVRPVTVAIAQTRDVPLYLEEIGNCSAFETVMIQPQVSGPVTEIHFEDGAEIKKGDLLFTIDPRPYQATLDRAKATLEANRIRAANDVVQQRRSEELRRTQAIPAQELENVTTTAKASQVQVQADEAAVETARINLEYCTIRSPIDGRASKRMVDIGNVVSPSTQMLLIQRQDPIYVDFTTTERQLPAVRAHMAAGTAQVEAIFVDDSQKRRTGELNFLDSGIQSSTGTVRLRGLLENKDRLFWPGQFVNVRLLLDTLEGAVLVPSEALQIGQTGPFVFVVKADSTVELRPVKPGQRQGDDVVISEGLKSGETVVVTGQLALAPGTPVAVKNGPKGVAGEPAKEPKR